MKHSQDVGKVKSRFRPDSGERDAPNKEIFFRFFVFVLDIMIFNLFQKLKYTFTSFEIQYIWHTVQTEKKETQTKGTVKKQIHRSDDM